MSWFGATVRRCGEAYLSLQPLEDIRGAPQGGLQLEGVLEPARLQGEINDGLVEVGLAEGAVVLRLHGVRLHLGDDTEEAVELAGMIADVDAQSQQSSVLGEAALDDPREDVHVDIAAAHDDRDPSRRRVDAS